MFLRGTKKKRSEDDTESIIGDIPVRSSQKTLSLIDRDHFLT